MKLMLLFLFCCFSVLADEGQLRVFSIAHTNADNWVYNKDEFTRDGQTNLVRILKIVPGQGWVRMCRFFHTGQVVGSFVVHDGETSFSSEPSIYCIGLKYGLSGEIQSARVGDKTGLIVDEFAYTNGTFSPVEGPLRHREGMRPLFGDEAEFIKKAAEAEARTSEVSVPDYEAKPQIVASKTSDVDANLARQMVQFGKQEFKEGELVLAEETLRQATQTDPLNNEAWYYRYQVNKAIRDKHHGPRLWYPTLPPRPASNEGIP